jgi:glycosyltransferase A (GT-A) superfamily protein (DUF2064 family)
MSDKKCKQALVIFFEDRNRSRIHDVLTNDLSEQQKAQLYDAFLEDTIVNCIRLDDIYIRVCYKSGTTGEIVQGILSRLEQTVTSRSLNVLKSDRFQLMESSGESVGDRIVNASQMLFEKGFEQVAMIGCVTPTLPRHNITNAFKRAARHDLVIGPTLEGSYYLFAMSRPLPDLFGKVDWSLDDTVYSQITSLCKEANLTWDEMDIWYDLRQPGDLEFLVRDINHYRLVGDEKSALRTEQVLEEILKNLPS